MDDLLQTGHCEYLIFLLIALIHSTKTQMNFKKTKTKIF